MTDRYSKIIKVIIARGDGTNAFRTSALLPIAAFIEALGFPAICVPTVNPA